MFRWLLNLLRGRSHVADSFNQRIVAQSRQLVDAGSLFRLALSQWLNLGGSTLELNAAFEHMSKVVCRVATEAAALRLPEGIQGGEDLLEAFHSFVKREVALINTCWPEVLSLTDNSSPEAVTQQICALIEREGPAEDLLLCQLHRLQTQFLAANTRGT